MATGNQLLDALPKAVFRREQSALEPVELKFKEILHRPNKPIDYVYFPVRGVLSMVNEPNPGQIVEFATVGREGVSGFPVLLGAESMPSRTLIQIPGDGFRMKAAAFRKMVAGSGAARDLTLRYTMALVTQIAQITSCNRLHEVQERCARWLLQTHDRVDGDSFTLTQEFLGQMLGVYRPSVSIAARMLQKEGLIDYSRSTITILDRPGLEKASCSCYRFIIGEYKRLIGGNAAGKSGAGRTAGRSTNRNNREAAD